MVRVAGACHLMKRSLVSTARRMTPSSFLGRMMSTAVDRPTCRVLSMQSHTVFGYVGNKAAVFPMQLLGLDVDSIHTITLSNHAAYPTCKGEQLQPSALNELIEGLHLNRLLDYDYVISKSPVGS